MALGGTATVADDRIISLSLPLSVPLSAAFFMSYYCTAIYESCLIGWITFP